MSSAMDMPDTPDRGNTLLVVLAVALGLAWLLVLLRAYTKFCVLKNVASDDWWMFASMVAYTAYSFDAIWGILDGGTGRHLNQLTPEQIYIGLKAWYISEILYAPVSAMVRTSVALFLMRVSVSPRFRWIIIVNLAIVWTMSIIFMFVVTFQCDPPSYFYGQALGLEGHCLPITVVPNITIAHSVIGGLCDLIFASLPVPMLWNVQINKRTKIIIALLLGMGAVGGVALMVRIPFIRVLAISSDFLYETIDVAIWSVVEPSLGIIAGCIATLRPLVKGMGFGRNSTKGSKYSYSRGNRYLEDGLGSDATWLSRGAAQELTDGPPSPSDPCPAEIVGKGPSVDIEMRAMEATEPPPSTVKTDIVSNGRAGFHDELSGLRGINVCRSIRLESQPSQPSQPKRALLGQPRLPSI